jgi:hypothetical protein
MTVDAEALDMLLTRPAGRVPVPGWIRTYAPRTVSGDKVAGLRGLPELTVVEAEGPRAILRRSDFLESLERQHSRTPGAAKILFVFKDRHSDVDARRMSDVLSHFSRLTDIEFARGSRQAAFALQEVIAKIWASRSRGAAAEPDDDPLGRSKSVIAATAPLRAASGRLSARRVAAVFGLSVAELARVLGKSRQALAKTDDAESSQAGLSSFARIARLRAVLPDDDFRAWLHLPNEELEGRTPSVVIRHGNPEVVADLAEDMLSGSPA